MPLNLRKRIIKNVRYGTGTWSLNKNNIDRLEAFEMWTWREVKRICWSEKKHEFADASSSRRRKVADKQNKENTFKLSGTCTTTRCGLLRDVIEDKIIRNRNRGRPTDT